MVKRDEIPPTTEDTPEAETQEAPRTTADYARYEPPGKPKRKLPLAAKLPRPTISKPPSKLLKTLAGLLILVAIGAGIYWFFLRPEPKADTDRDEPEQTQQEEAFGQITKATQRYDSTNFTLGFDYPQDWTVSDEGGGQMTVTSPALKLKDTNEQDVTSQIILTIRDKAQELSEFETGNATAALASQKIDYTNPSENQRGTTHASFLRYSGSSSGLDGIYITGDTGYQADQSIPKADFTPVEPIISLTFNQCADGSCSGEATPLTISLGNWENSAISTPLLNMLKSFNIQ